RSKYRNILCVGGRNLIQTVYYSEIKLEQELQGVVKLSFQSDEENFHEISEDLRGKKGDSIVK
ncbi:MAG: hypothetical protein ACI4S0_00845, partial [Dorea sp.]